MKIKRSWPFVGIAALAALAFWESPYFPEYDPYCEYENPKQEHCAAYQFLLGFCRNLFKTLDDHNGSVTALAGVAVAVFTYLLKRSTDSLWKAGRESLETTERAFVYIDGFEIELTTAQDGGSEDIEVLPEMYRNDPGLFVTRFAVQPRWRNSGHTPTRNMKIRVDFGASPDANTIGTYKLEKQNFFVGPGAISGSQFLEIGAMNMIIEANANMIIEANVDHAPSPIILIWGRADYDDVFGKKHFAEWCYQVLPARYSRSQRMGAHFFQWGDYNRTDKD
jgi:hypothetical protein